jgi:uncharacterized ion transporter superfamily protein YfcC
VVIATQVVPAGQYELNEEGEPIPGSYHWVESNSQRSIADGLMAPISGIYGLEGEDSLVSRLFIPIEGTIIGIISVTRYAERHRRDPSKSLIYDQKEENEKHFLKTMSAKAYPSSAAAQGCPSLIWPGFPGHDFRHHPLERPGCSAAQLDRWFGEFAAFFLGFAILIGYVGKVGGEAKISEMFVAGARDVLGMDLIIAAARGVSVIMTNGLIVDSVLSWTEDVGGLETRDWGLGIGYWLFATYIT